MDAARNIADKLPRVPDRLRNLGATVETVFPETNRDAIDTLFREVTLLTRTTGALTQLGERTSGFERDLEAVAGGAAP